MFFEARALKMNKAKFVCVVIHLVNCNDYKKYKNQEPSQS